MDDIRVGRVFRAVRIRADRRQADVAVDSGLAQSTISLMERGHLDRLTVASIRRLAASLDVSIEFRARWRGGELDRLLDRGHARLVERTVASLRASGWEVRVEYSFNQFGDRGSADIVGWHPMTRSLLLVEVKSALVDLQDLFRAMAVKARVLPPILAAREGWDATQVGRVIVVPGTTRNRSIVARHRETFDLAFPQRGPEVRRWVRAPVGPLAGIWFSRSDPDDARHMVRGRQRVRVRAPRVDRAAALVAPGERHP